MLAGVMLYVLYGRDDFSLREELGQIKARLDSDGMLASNTDVLDGREVTPQQLMGICDTVPFLGDHRLVVVEGLLKRFDRAERRRGARAARRESPVVDQWLGLAEHTERMPESTILVLVDEELSADNPLLAALRPKGQVREFRPLRRGAVLPWILKRAEAQEIEISPTAARLLADLVGNDLWTLTSELRKLTAYAQGRRIEGTDVKALVSEARQVSIFAMVDAIVEKRPTVALRLLRHLQNTGAEGGYLLAMIVRQYRFILQARDLMTDGLSTREIGQRVGISSDFVLQRVLDQAERYTLPRLKRAYRRLLEADVAVKHGLYSEDLTLELLVHDLARL
jgi:DNA polymerase-3 subunit delta